MSTQLSSSTIIAGTAATAATCLLAYAVYFDHRRRNDPDFRRSLKREARRTAKAAKQEAEAGRAEEMRKVREVINEVDELPTNPDEIESYFMQEVARGEKLCNDGSFLKFLMSWSAEGWIEEEEGKRLCIGAPAGIG
jgi:mitochondrial import receptor subunit TOM20